jgi:ATP synthase protein I
MSDRRVERPDAWADVEDEGASRPFKALTREEAQALAARNPSVSPWRVIVVQAAVGLVMAVLAWFITDKQGLVWSVLFGAATVVVPGALMARGMTSRLTSMAPGVSAVSFMLWEFGKIGVSVVMLALAPKLVPDLSWPALLVALIVCIKVYWVALSWRGRKKI